MNRSLSIFSLSLCILLGPTAEHASADAAESTFVISSQPKGAAVFHYLRGRNHFLGYTPLKISSEDLRDREHAKIRLLRFGYREKLYEFDTDGYDQQIELAPQPRPYVVIEGETNQSLSRCGSRLEKIIAETVRSNFTSQLAFQSPLYLTQTDNKTEIRLMSSIINRDDIKRIRQLGRRDNEKAIAYAENVVGPAVTPLIHKLEQINCLDSAAVVAEYQRSGLKISFTPYRDYWSRTSEYVSGGTKYTTITYGSKIELYSSMVQSKKNKSFLFRYRLR